jgi:hypothetical protein
VFLIGFSEPQQLLFMTNDGITLWLHRFQLLGTSKSRRHRDGQHRDPGAQPAPSATGKQSRAHPIQWGQKMCAGAKRRS